MSRVTSGVVTHARHKKVIKAAKGYYGRRKNTFKVAAQAVAGGVLVGFVYGLRSNFKDAFTTAIIAFGGFDDFAMTGVGDHTTFYT